MLLRFEPVRQTKALHQTHDPAAETSRQMFNNLARAIWDFEDVVVERENWCANDKFNDAAPNFVALKTKVQAARLQVFQEAVELIESGALKPINLIWCGMDADERASFCAKFEGEIWTALERVADCQR